MTKKLFIHPDDKLHKSVWLESAKRLGIPVYPVMSADTVWVALSDQTAFAPARADTAALTMLMDNITSQTLPMKVVPAVVADSEANVRYFGDVPLFVKRRLTRGKDVSGFAYTKWASPQTLLDAGILSAAADATRGEYVVQPQIEYPLRELSVGAAINADGVVKVFWAIDNISESVDKRSLTHSPADVPADVLYSIQTAVTITGVKNAVHMVDFVMYSGEWCLLDWNPRPAAGMEKPLYGFDFIPDTALAHIFDLTAPEIQPHYSEQRSYWSAPLTAAQMQSARAHGLMPRFNSGVCNKLVGHGASQAEVHQKFLNYESNL
jgi:hypothetical protein